MKFINICYEGMPEKEIYYLKKLEKECENINEKFGIAIISSKNFDEKLIDSKCTTVVYDENEGRGLPYGIDLVVGSFEEIDANFLIKLWKHKNGLPCEIAITERTVIRELCRADIDEVVKMSRQEHILRFVEDGRTSENEQREKLLAYIENIYKFYDYGIWGIFEKNYNLLIGVISLDLLTNTANAEYEVGFFIREEKLCKGFGSEALRAVLGYAKSNLLVTKIVAITDKENVNSIKLLEKCGFRRRKQDGSTKGCSYTFELY